MMLFVFGPETFEDQDRLFDGRRLDFDGLESAFESGILLDVFAILVERRGADALHLTAA